jgi:TolB-like protein/predicted Ser/Thr protein kinase
MEAARWERVQALFHSAADLEEPQRTGFLEKECGDDRSLVDDVRRMLEEDGRAGLLDGNVTEWAADRFGDALAAWFRDFSPYRIQQVLGEGGMGVVYLAERKDLGNLVAIKILRDGWLSPGRRERFAAEQRMLAQLNHPSIARLYDANTLPDGTPWFVMEYVDGVPLTEYCRRNNCSADERVRLIRAVAEAVQYAHEHGVVHRDLKPSNILVKADGSLRLLDFGIAKQLDPDGRPVNQTRTALRPMTPAYASPEQLRGEPVGAATDVYSLGVVLYELSAGKLPFDLANKTASEAEAIVTAEEPARPSATGARTLGKASWAKLDALCLRAMEKDTRRRYGSAAALIGDVDRYLNHEPLEAQTDSWLWSMGGFARRNSRAVSIGLVACGVLALVAAAVALTLNFSRRGGPLPGRSRTVAVLPLVNASADHSLDFLSQAVADEIARTLGYARSISLRSADSARQYAAGLAGLQKAGHDLRAATVVSGHFIRAGDRLQITLDLTDVESGRQLWSDVFEAPPENLMAMQAQIAAKTRRAMAPVLGVSEFVTADPPKPANEEAYRLYMRAIAVPDEISTDHGYRKRAIEMLNRSLALDPSYAPAWQALATWYGSDGWFGDGGQEALERWRTAARHAAALDPDNAVYQAGNLYFGSLRWRGIANGGVARGEAYREMADLLRRRPDSARLHFLMSWLLRDTGLLDEAARECDASVLIDAQDAGARSCGVTFMQRRDYRRALDYLRLDPDSEVSIAVSIDVLVRQGKEKEALQVMAPKIPQWGGYAVLRAGLEHRPAAEIAALAGEVSAAPDPEVNYFSAAHLAYAGQTDAALALLKRAVEDGYCAVPAIDSDTMFAGVRGMAGFAEIRAAGMACQKEFRAEREK